MSLSSASDGGGRPQDQPLTGKIKLNSNRKHDVDKD